MDVFEKGSKTVYCLSFVYNRRSYLLQIQTTVDLVKAILGLPNDMLLIKIMNIIIMFKKMKNLFLQNKSRKVDVVTTPVERGSHSVRVSYC